MKNTLRILHQVYVELFKPIMSENIIASSFSTCHMNQMDLSVQAGGYYHHGFDLCTTIYKTRIPFKSLYIDMKYIVSLPIHLKLRALATPTRTFSLILIRISPKETSLRKASLSRFRGSSELEVGAAFNVQGFNSKNDEILPEVPAPQT